MIVYIETEERLFVKLKGILILFDLRLVALFQILAQNHVAILSHRLHSGFLTDGRDFCSRQLVRPGDD